MGHPQGIDSKRSPHDAPQKTLLRLGNHIQSRRIARALLRYARAIDQALGVRRARRAARLAGAVKPTLPQTLGDALEKRSRKHQPLGQRGYAGLPDRRVRTKRPETARVPDQSRASVSTTMEHTLERVLLDVETRELLYMYTYIESVANECFSEAVAAMTYIITKGVRP